MPSMRTNDIVTYYEVQGEGERLVFLHGAGAFHDMWRPQVERFSSKYKVLTYHLRARRGASRAF